MFVFYLPRAVCRCPVTRPHRLQPQPRLISWRGPGRRQIGPALNSGTLSLDTRVPQLCINNIGKPYSAEVTHGHCGIYYVSLLTRCWYKLSLPVWVLVQMYSIHHIHWLQSQPVETACGQGSWRAVSCNSRFKKVSMWKGTLSDTNLYTSNIFMTA